jgi:predicted lipoprotein
MISRRLFLAQGSSAFVIAGSSGLAACKRNVTRPEVLRAIAEDVALPAMRALPEEDARLVRAIDALPALPSVQSLAAVKSALSSALLAWERAYLFRTGPLVESNAFLRARFWPVRKSSFHELLLGDAPVDPAHVAQLGVDLKGLFALERLFWERVPREGGGEAVLFELRPERARVLASSLAKDVQRHSDAAAALLGDGKAFVVRFARGSKDSVALLVNQLVESSEAIVTDRLERALGLQRNGRLHPGDLLGDFSNLTTELTVTGVKGLSALYLGAREDGLCLLVQQAAPAIDAHLRSAFRKALKDCETLAAPLAQLVAHDAAKIERARDSMKALELALKVELPSALGVTLSIAAGDGD